MATAKKSTEVATQQPTGLMFAQEAPDHIKQGAGRGSEEVKASDMVLPRLEIVQSQSPIKEVDGDIKDGNLYNSVTQENLGDMIYFVPVYYRMEWLVWKDADKGGGFFGSHATEADAQSRVTEEIENGESAEDLEIVDTPVQYGLLVKEDGTAEQIVISMARTKAKVSRKWNAMISIAGGDRFSRVYKISSFRDENKKGQKFFNYVVQPAGFTPKAIYEQAEKTYDILKTQDFRVAHETAAPQNDTGSSERGDI